jgi:flavin-dependent dehydrogenase
MRIASPHFDLAVIGGGPAGSSAAITAARAGARIALFESRQFPRHKVCGEFVSAEALDVLARLLQPAGSSAGCAAPPGLETLLQNAPVMGRTRLWLGNRMLEAAISPPAVSVTRYQLDWSLWRAAQAAGVECRDNCEVSALEGDGPFAVKAAVGTITSRALIVAAGRWSQFLTDRTLPAGPKWIGLKAHFREARPSLTTDLYFFRHGYCGVQPVSEDVVNACAMVRSDVASSLPEVFRLHSRLHERSDAWQPMIPVVTTAPLFYRAPQPVRGHTAFVGDAAGFIDPFVGDGISIALRSGEAAAQYLRGFLAGECRLEESIAAYRREYSRQFAPLLAVAARVRGLLSLQGFAQRVGFEMLRLPGLLPFIIRRTRQAA